MKLSKPKVNPISDKDQGCFPPNQIKYKTNQIFLNKNAKLKILPAVKFNMNKITKTKDALKISGQGSSIARIGIQRIHQTQ